MTSAYRNPERNERVGGATASRHMLGRALDIGIDGVSVEQTGIAYYILWEIFKNTRPPSADLIQIEDSPAHYVKRKQAVNNWTVENQGWNSDIKLYPLNGIADGFYSLEHLHLQDNP